MNERTTNRFWYLVYTKPRSENKALSHLAEQGYQVYLPRCRIKKTRKGKRIPAIEALFPNYLFIKLDPEQDNWSPIRSTPGVNKLVRFGPLPTRVPDAFVEQLKAREDEEGLQEISQPNFQAGDEVRVVEGPMAGLEAIYHTTKGSARALILLKILGKATPVELETEQLEPR